MSNAFKPVTISFSGKEYTVPSDKVWGLIGTIEDHITLVRLAGFMMRNDVPRIKVSEAMAAALRYAGCNVTALEVSSACDTVGIIEQATALATILSIAEAPQDSNGGAGEQEAGQGKAPPPPAKKPPNKRR